MTPLAIAFALLVATLAAPAQGTASVEGTVALPKLTASGPLTKRYAGPGGVAAAPELPTAVVYVEGAPVPAGPDSATNVVQFIQQGMQFRPGILAVRKGTRVEFPNKDDFYHNVFSYSKAKRFDLGRYLKDEKPASVTFDQVGVVKLYCEIHEHMRGTVLVLDTPYFVQTDSNGTYRLTGLPAGQFKLKAWINEKLVPERSVELKPGTTTRVDFPAP